MKLYFALQYIFPWMGNKTTLSSNWLIDFNQTQRLNFEIDQKTPLQEKRDRDQGGVSPLPRVC